MTENKTLRIALGQFSVRESSEENQAVVRDLIDRAEAGGAELLVMPESVIAQKPGAPAWSRTHAEPLDGPFVTALREATKGRRVTVVCTVLARIPGETRCANDLLVVRDGKVLLTYQKLHLYDAFSGRESDNCLAGESVPELVDIGPFRCGFMTCYDIRFPELARALALKGANLFVVSAAWYRGPLKESHWDITLRSRALENTAFVAAVSECGAACIGSSKIVDPLGVVTAQCGSSDQLLFADIEADAVTRARASLPVLENRRFAAPRLREAGEL